MFHRKEHKVVTTSTVGQDNTGPFESNFAEKCLKAHNEKRDLHKAARLKLSSHLCAYAEEWAAHLAKVDKLEHRPDTPHGENVYMGNCPGHTIKAAEVVDRWYKESDDHVFHKEPPTLKTGHFTQVVWAKTVELGVGVAQNSDSGNVYVVANYSPPGNIQSTYSENVPPIGGFSQPSRGRLFGLAKKEATLEEELLELEKGMSTLGRDPNKEQTSEEFAQDCLNAHNVFRKKHNAPPLKLNKQLCKYAQEWAEQLALAKELKHRSDNKYGENVYMVYNPGHYVTGAEAAHHWYSEVKKHKFYKEPETLETGHFTQVVWLKTKEFGAGKAKTAKGEVYMVANYDPPGNYSGCFVENVLKPIL